MQRQVAASFDGTSQLISAVLEELKSSDFFASINASPLTANPDIEEGLVAHRLLNELLPEVRLKSHQLVGHPLGRYLHGQMVAKITQAAQKVNQLHLDQLASEFTVEKIQEGLLAHQLGANFYELLKGSWDGLLDITFEGDLDFYLHMQPAQSIEVADVIDELLINASRHGQATAILVNLVHTGNRKIKGDQEITITAIDNGAGLHKITKPGLGSHLFDVATDNRWSITQGKEEGCVVQLIITIPEQAREAFDLPEDLHP